MNPSSAKRHHPTRWLLVACALLIGATSAWGAAQEIRSEVDPYGQRILTIDGWRLILPRMYRDRDGTVWLDWQYPDGTGRGFGYPLDTHLATTGRTGDDPRDLFAWFRAGDVPAGATRESTFDLPGYPLEYVVELIDWWTQGGDGCFVAEANGWREVPCTTAPPPTTTPTTPASPCVPGGGPFSGGCVVIGGIGMVAIPDPLAVGMAELAQAMQAAQQACNTTRDPDVCAEYYRLYAAYNQRMNNP